MPATGLVPPARTFVAVLAIVPVAHIPPNRAVPILATPCAISSIFERWRRPVIPSATTAERSDSIAPRKAIVAASGIRDTKRSIEIVGRFGMGSVFGMPPKRVPIVSTLNPKGAMIKVRSEANPIAIKKPGQCGFVFRNTRITAIENRLTRMAAGDIVPNA